MRPVQRTPFSASGPRDRYPMLQRAAVIASLKLAKTTCKTTCFTIWLKSILNTTNSHIFENVFEDRWIISHNHWVPCCSSCATGLLQNKDQNNLAVKGFFPAPSGSGPTKTPLKFQSLQFFFWSNSIRTYSGCCCFFFPAFFCPSCSSGLITPTSPQHPSPVFFGFTILFSASHRQQIGCKWRCGQKSIQKVRHAPPYSIGNIFEHWKFKALLPAQQLLFLPLVLRLHRLAGHFRHQSLSFWISIHDVWLETSWDLCPKEFQFTIRRTSFPFNVKFLSLPRWLVSAAGVKPLSGRTNPLDKSTL